MTNGCYKNGDVVVVVCGNENICTAYRLKKSTISKTFVLQWVASFCDINTVKKRYDVKKIFYTMSTTFPLTLKRLEDAASKS